MVGEEGDAVGACRRHGCGAGVAAFGFVNGGGNGIIGPIGVQLDTGTITAGISHGVATVAISLQFQKLRPVATAHPFQGLLGGGMDAQHIHAIDLFGRNPVPAGPFIDFGDGRVPVDFRTDLVVIVFANKKNRQLPECRHVQGFMESPLIDRAVPEKADHGLRKAAIGHRIGGPQGDGVGFADNGIAAQKAAASIEKMHGATHAFADAGFFAVQLGHDFPGRNAPHQGMDMLPVSADHIIAGFGGMKHTHGHGLLTRVEMQKARDLPLGIALGRRLLEGSGAEHVAEHPRHMPLIHAGPPAGIRPEPC